MNPSAPQPAILRPVERKDAAAIAEIYNHYVEHSTITFDTEPLSQEQMWQRIAGISSTHPYIVAESDGRTIGFCYAHPWKEKNAYRLTAETTVYIAPSHHRQGLGTLLMRKLIAECGRRGLKALIACITGGNDASETMHLNLGFRQVSHFEKVGHKFGADLDVNDFELLL